MNDMFDPPSDHQEQIDFGEVIKALEDESTPFPPRYLYQLSDLAGQELNRFQECWQHLSAQRKQSLLEDMEELADSNLALSFQSICINSLDDPEPQVRVIALRSLWGHEAFQIIDKALSLLDSDPAESVQAQAAAALGEFVYLGEIEELSRSRLEKITDQLLAAYDSQPSPAVRRRVLESLGFSGHARIPTLIADGYDYGDEDWVVSALVAMGRSADDQWQPHIVDKLTHDNNQIRLEAARAAGELSISDAAPHLIDLLSDQDEEVRLAAAWSLSEIGGMDAREAIEALLEQTTDDEEIDILENTLENLA